MPKTRARRAIPVKDLKTLRKKQGVTQTEVARRLDVSQPRVCQYEKDWELATLPTIRAYLGSIGFELVLMARPVISQRKVEEEE